MCSDSLAHGWHRLCRAVALAIVCTAVVGIARKADGQPLQLPGTIQAEDFDDGARDVAYSDSTIGNAGGAYRSTDVDVERTDDTGGGFNLGWVAAGEWLKYTVNVTTAGSYDLEVRVAARGAGGTFHIEIDGVDRTGPIAIPETGGWQQWASIKKPGLKLKAGPQAWRVMMDKAGEFAVGNINYFRVTSTAPSASPDPAPASNPARGPAPSPAPTEPPSADSGATEIVLYASDVTAIVGNWMRANHATGAGGQVMQSNDSGWSSANEALAAPADYFEARFKPVANKPYRVWMRLRANADSKFNDSVWLQFSGAVDAGGSPLWRIGTSSALLVNLETCPNCGVSGWGWQTAAWWVPEDSIVRFGGSTEQTLRVQTREDGVRIDQIILSSATYVDSPPGAPINDTEIVAKSTGTNPPANTPSASAPGPVGAAAPAKPTTSASGPVSNSAPVVAIISPVDRATFPAPATITVNASAWDSNGKVSRVDFYVGTQLIGSSAAAPYAATWTNAPPGTHTLRAVAVDDGGVSSNTSAISVIVNPAGPPPPRPTTLAFTASRDHDSKVTSYSVAIYRAEDPSSARPVDSASLGKPVPSNGEITVNISGIVNSLPSGWYYVVVNAHYLSQVVASAPSTPFPK
jgi:hypothetical protein